jgi:ATP-dependent exoDNAse (exonuclease V) alpha subunit
MVDVLVGPAGSGKTRTLQVLRTAWEAAHGAGSVLGLAPSATAAVELSASVAIPCENTTKWLYESAGGPAPGRERWALSAGQLLMVDEASMVTTEHLDRLVLQARGAGAKVLLVGDDQQLGAVGAGGAFGLLAESPHTQVLSGLWRFQHRWEANATRALRKGEPSTLDAYDTHGRILDGPGELMLDAAYRAWTTDLDEGRSALLLAADRATVTALNLRAHDARVQAGLAHDDGLGLADDTNAGRGDIVVTRRNARVLTYGSGREHVRNGALWTINNVHADGCIDVTPVGAERSGNVRLPADYVREHVELGYASTVHRAQGMTVDRCHVIATGTMNRQSFYVAMTRGRDANHVYVALDSPDNHCDKPAATINPTGREILRDVLATDAAERSATATMRQRLDDSTSLKRLLPIRELLSKAAHDPAVVDAIGQIDEVLRRRGQEARNRPDHLAAAPHGTTHEGIAR